MCKTRLCYCMLIITNILRCYGENIIAEVENEGTEGNKIKDDEDEKITDNDMNNITDNDINNRKTLKENKMEGKIVGGGFADIRDFPHAVFLSIDCNRDVFVCGSSVLNQRILLTAAHCLSICEKKMFKIYATAGSSNILDSTVIKKVNKYMIHRQYDDYTLSSDIAMIQLRTALPLSGTIQRVIIRQTFPENSRGIVTGWGDTYEYQRSTARLKGVKQIVWNFRKCNDVQEMMIGTFCASSGSSTNYPFKGDSGSGLVTKHFQVIGLVSHKGDTELVVYTNVSFYYNWIVAKSVQLRCAYE